MSDRYEAVDHERSSVFTAAVLDHETGRWAPFVHRDNALFWADAFNTGTNPDVFEWREPSKH